VAPRDSNESFQLSPACLAIRILFMTITLKNVPHIQDGPIKSKPLPKYVNRIENPSILNR